MNIKTFIVLFLLGISCSCTLTYEKNFPVDDVEHEAHGNGTFNK